MNYDDLKAVIEECEVLLEKAKNDALAGRSIF